MRTISEWFCNDNIPKELEREKEDNVSIEFSPIKSTDYNNELSSSTTTDYDTTLDEYMPIYENDSIRFKNLYKMNQQELSSYGHLINNHLTEISSVMWDRFKVTAFLNRPVNIEIVRKAKKLIYGGS
jgi:hypothetical protein